jgi:transposase
LPNLTQLVNANRWELLYVNAEGIAQDPPSLRAFVDSLNLKEMGIKTRESIDGQPSFAPSLLLKIWLYVSYGKINSCRKLERMCKRDIALLWLTGMNSPDHNTFWRFFSENKKAIKEFSKHR